MKQLNLKTMKETIINYSTTQTEFNKIWDTFYEMQCLGFISFDTWCKFFDDCHGWYIDEENFCVRDECRCTEGVDAVVWEYNDNSEYHASRARV